MTEIKHVSATTRKIKLVNAQISKLDKQTKTLEGQRKKLVERERLEKVARAGVKVGGYYKAIPTERAADVLTGKVLKITLSDWRDEVQIAMLLPPKGRFAERTAHLSLGQYSFEKLLAGKKK